MTERFRISHGGYTGNFVHVALRACAYIYEIESGVQCVENPRLADGLGAIDARGTFRTILLHRIYSFIPEL